MKIEVACKKEDSTKKKGDLLEKLSKKLLEAQGYSVIEEIRMGADLLSDKIDQKMDIIQIFS